MTGRQVGNQSWFREAVKIILFLAYCGNLNTVLDYCCFYCSRQLELMWFCFFSPGVRKTQSLYMTTRLIAPVSGMSHHCLGLTYEGQEPSGFGVFSLFFEF